MKHLIIYTISIIVLVSGFYACDSTTAPENPLSESPSIQVFDISPTSINFTFEEDGYKDTTITIELNLLISNASSSNNPQYAISEKNSGDIIAEGELTFLDASPHNYSTDVLLPTTTTTIENYTVNVFYEDDPQVYAQTGFSILGFSNNPPELLNVENPSEVRIPSSGRTPIQFKAKATDADGQSTIQGVYMRLISRTTGEADDSPFLLLDDGQSTGNSGDEIAQDSVFTLTLEISSGNQPDHYDLEYYAIDKGNLVSDTLTSTLRVRN